MDYYEFKGQIVLVTGGSSGIGKATALKFAELGAKVIITSKGKERGTETIKKLRDIQDDCMWIQMDVLDPLSIDSLFSQISEGYSKLDVAFNNASAGGARNIIHKSNLEDWNLTIQGTLSSVFQCMKYEIERMIKNGKGAIINNSSVDGLRAFPLDPTYSAAKHGILGLTKSAAIQYAQKGIRINAICPGWINTPPIINMIKEDESLEKMMIDHQPIGRLGRPEEVADAVIWLASSKASFLIGNSLPVDGGYTIV